MPGPPRKPTKMLEASGSWLADERKNRSEPEPELGAPSAPEWLSERAREKFDELIPILESMRVLTVADGDAVAAYCQALDDLIECQNFIFKNGRKYAVKDKVGRVVSFRQFPEAAHAIKLRDQVCKLGRELGLSPASRSHIQALPGKPAGGKLRFFKSKDELKKDA